MFFSWNKEIEKAHLTVFLLCLFKDMEGKYVSNEEKEFFERMKFKIENEPAPANDLIMSNRNNNDGIYIVRCYDYAFRIGCHVGEFMVLKQKKLRRSQGGVNLQVQIYEVFL